MCFVWLLNSTKGSYGSFYFVAFKFILQSTLFFPLLSPYINYYGIKNDNRYVNVFVVISAFYLIGRAHFLYAGLAELADAMDLKSIGLCTVSVQIR